MVVKGEKITPENRTALEIGERVRSMNSLFRWLAQHDREPTVKEKRDLLLWRSELAYLRKFGWSPTWRTDMEAKERV